MNRITRATLTLVATTLAAGACHDAPTAPPAVGPSLATSRYLDNYRFSVEYTGYAPCANGGLGEQMLVRIDGHNVIHTVVAANGRAFMRHDFGQSHGTGVGLTTGDAYRLVNVYVQTETGRPETSGFTNTVAYNARLIHRGSGVELHYRSIIHATRSASGELIVYFEREHIACG